MEMLRLTPAARRIGVHPLTLRRWANEGRIPVVIIGRERRFSTTDIDAMLGGVDQVEPETVVELRLECLYVRVSGSSGQETSLAAQEVELRASSTGSVVHLFKDKASGLRENRPGLIRLLKSAAAGEFTVVRVTHSDRLARFGNGWIEMLLARDGVTVEVLHPKGSAGGMEELLADFMSLVSTFAGRMYGIRSREARTRLLQAATSQLDTVDE